MTKPSAKQPALFQGTVVPSGRSARNAKIANQTIKQSNNQDAPAAFDLARFHPVIAEWFRRRFRDPTDAQAAGWPLIQTGRDVLIAAPTGSGKTLAAFLCGIDSLVKAATGPTAGQLEAGVLNRIHAEPVAGPVSDSVRPEPVEGRDVQPRPVSGSSAHPRPLTAHPEALEGPAASDRTTAPGTLPAITRIVYVSPLKALGNDIQRNLETPLAELAEVAAELGYATGPAAANGAAAGTAKVWPDIRVGLRTGDTPQKDRQAFVKTPPHILITTPESLYLMLTAQRARETLRHVHTVIVDEIHALARDKRGSHLSLSLARLDHVCERRPARIGLSATQRPVEEIAAFLVGTDHVERPLQGTTSTNQTPESLDPGLSVHSPRRNRRGAVGEVLQAPSYNPVRPELVEGPEFESVRPELVEGRGVQSRPDGAILDLGHQRDIELHIEVPPSDLEAVAAREQWGDVYERLAGLVRAHRTTLIFVNTRRLSERIAHHLRERLGEEAVASHHGSLSRERRLRVEQRLKDGDLKALVCTASLELGIDIGAIDLVCQIGSPRSIATFLQRVGRSGHALGLRPQGRLFPTSRDELVECAALVRAVRAGRLDRIVQPLAPLDILAQQIVAECACEDWTEDALYDLVRRAWPYRDLCRDDFDDVIEMLAEGVGEGAGRSPPLLHHDRINRVLRGRRGARMTAILNGGAIPELADYRVVAEPDDTVVGTVGEDWAIESMTGDIFLLGSHSWRIKRVAANEVRVEDARGAPPTIPFWVGEAPGRTRELSHEVALLRRDVVDGLGDSETLRRRLMEETGLDELGAVQVIDYLRAGREALGVMPTDTDVVFERFFDESGGMQLVVHAPFGSRINRAWGLTLRKRFCVRFDFELQAAASDDAIVLSLGPQHSFPLEESFSYVTSRNAEQSLRQAVLYAPVFPVRWRWDAGRALAVPRYSGARKVPPQIQRLRADDLLAAVFPAQVGCQENLTGPLEIPDHPLVRQTVLDCLHEAMDLDGLVDVLQRVEAGEIRLHAIDTLEPSPMAHEILNGKPYTYLDDAPLEERRTRAVTLRRALPENARELGALDADAIERVRDEAWPQPRDAEETHDALLSLVAVPASRALSWGPWLDELVEAGRAARLMPPGNRAIGQSDNQAVGQSGELEGPESDPVRPEPVEGRDVQPRSIAGQDAEPVPLTAHPQALEGPSSSGQPGYGAEAAGLASQVPSPLGERARVRGQTPHAQDEQLSTAYPLSLEAQTHPDGPSSARALYFAVENLRLVRHLYPNARIEPGLKPPENALAAVADRDDARARLLRGWTEASGPVTPSGLEDLLALRPVDIERGLRGLEGLGFVLRGRFGPGAEEDEYCDRRLLARIHRYTLDRLRREIDPVSAQDFMRFLLRWQHLTPDTRLAGKQGVRQAIARLEGFEAPAGAWERELLAARVTEYHASWLDELCLAGEVAWARLTPRKGSSAASSATATRATPVSLTLRPDLPGLLAAVRGLQPDSGGPRTGAAVEILELLRGRGALFFDEIVNGTRRLRSDVERGLRELIAWGLVTADGFQGLRQLSGKAAHSGRRRSSEPSYSAGGFFTGIGPAGRWALVQTPELDSAAIDDLAESVARLLLQRYGVLFRDLYARESFSLPWRDVLRALRRLEARGQGRGGRFVSGPSGEQYALPEAVDALRRVRRTERGGEKVWVSAIDPLNLAGVILPGGRIPAQAGKGVLYIDGLPQPEPAAPAGAIKAPVPSRLSPRLPTRAAR